MLEFNSVFRGHQLGILMVFFEEVMDRRLVEFSSESESSSSDSTSTLLGETTHVVTEIISIVLSAFSLELSESFFGVTSSFRSSSNVT